MPSTRVTVPVAAFTIAFAAHAQAALHDRGGGLIYDDVQNITWLQDANYAKTSGYDADGLMDWDSQMAWVSALSFHDSVRDVTYTDWRLPNTFDIGNDGCLEFNRVGGTDCGFKPLPSSSELAHLFYVTLGNKGQPDPDYGLTNAGPFLNFGENYWSGTEYVLNPTRQAWGFGIHDGHQDPHTKRTVFLNAWAVRDGDVAAAIPEPATCALLLAGLGAVATLARRRKAQIADGASA